MLWFMLCLVEKQWHKCVFLALVWQSQLAEFSAIITLTEKICMPGRWQIVMFLEKLSIAFIAENIRLWKKPASTVWSIVLTNITIKLERNSSKKWTITMTPCAADELPCSSNCIFSKLLRRQSTDFHLLYCLTDTRAVVTFKCNLRSFYFPSFLGSRRVERVEQE